MANIWDDLQLSKSWSNVCHPTEEPYWALGALWVWPVAVLELLRVLVPVLL